MSGTFQAAIYVGGGLLALLLVLLSLPHSKLRDLLMPVVAWGFTLLCAIYAISPVDLVPEIALGPFGLVDDAGAVIAGLMSARAAMRAAKPSRP